MSSTIGTNIKLSIFGQSHSKVVGVVIDGLPAGESINMDQVQEFMDRRRPGQGAHTTARKESDNPQVLSGILEGKTCGAPLAIIIDNNDARPQDYVQVGSQPRPGHADFSAWRKYNGRHDFYGGGHFSGRLTAPLCFAGAVCKQILTRRGVTIGAHILSVGDVMDAYYDSMNMTADELREISDKKPLSVIDDACSKKMLDLIAEVREDQDSIGGQIECCALGIPAGIGDPIFDGMENRIAQAVFGIPAVRGIEFGAGFAAARMRGSEHNDSFISDGGVVRTSTNKHGGILGGISTGMPLIFRTAFKPTPSIGKLQQTVDLLTGETIPLEIHGRHDPCIVSRAVPCIEAAAAVQILDLMLSDHKGF